MDDNFTPQLQDVKGPSRIHRMVEAKVVVYPHQVTESSFGYPVCPHCRFAFRGPHVCFEMHRRIQRDLEHQAYVDAQNLKNIKKAEWTQNNNDGLVH